MERTLGSENYLQQIRVIRHINRENFVLDDRYSGQIQVFLATSVFIQYYGIAYTL